MTDTTGRRASPRGGARASRPAQGARGGGGGDVSTDGPLIDIYARLSFAADGSEINVNGQIAQGRADIERRGGQVGKIHRDNSKSGWNPKVARPEWNTLMNRLEG